MLGRTVFLAFLGAFAALAQQSEFDVATVKLSPPPEGDRININLGRTTHGKVTLSNATLSDCIKFSGPLHGSAASRLFHIYRRRRNGRKEPAQLPRRLAQI